MSKKRKREKNAVEAWGRGGKGADGTNKAVKVDLVRFQGKANNYNQWPDIQLLQTT